MNRAAKLVVIFILASGLGAWLMGRLFAPPAGPAAESPGGPRVPDVPARGLPDPEASGIPAMPARAASEPAREGRPLELKPQPVPSLPPRSQARDLRTPPRDWVDFKTNADGFAVAYGDLLLGKAVQSDAPRSGRAEAPVPQLWASREIPYSIDPALPRPERVKAAIELFHAATPIRFVPFSGQRDSLVFEVGSEHCYSYLGRIGGAQPVRLSEGCGSGEIVHELMHALGFVHEHSRTDRDLYVEILWDNIEPGYEEQFYVAPERWMATYRDVPFDLQSTLLYRADTFARPGLQTLRAKGANPLAPLNPTSDGLSAGDIQKIRAAYGQ